MRCLLLFYWTKRLGHLVILGDSPYYRRTGKKGFVYIDESIKSTSIHRLKSSGTENKKKQSMTDKQGCRCRLNPLWKNNNQ